MKREKRLDEWKEEDFERELEMTAISFAISTDRSTDYSEQLKIPWRHSSL